MWANWGMGEREGDRDRFVMAVRWQAFEITHLTTLSLISTLPPSLCHLQNLEIPLKKGGLHALPFVDSVEARGWARTLHGSGDDRTKGSAIERGGNTNNRVEGQNRLRLGQIMGVWRNDREGEDAWGGQIRCRNKPRVSKNWSFVKRRAWGWGVNRCTKDHGFGWGMIWYGGEQLSWRLGGRFTLKTMWKLV